VGTTPSLQLLDVRGWASPCAPVRWHCVGPEVLAQHAATGGLAREVLEPVCTFVASSHAGVWDCFPCRACFCRTCVLCDDVRVVCCHASSSGPLPLPHSSLALPPLFLTPLLPLRAPSLSPPRLPQLSHQRRDDSSIPPPRRSRRPRRKCTTPCTSAALTIPAGYFHSPEGYSLLANGSPLF